jgi:DNA-binding Xre family transcriptional regulator
MHFKLRGHISKPFMVEIAWRIDAIAAWLLNRKRKLTQATAVASYSTNRYSNDKIKKGP